MTLNRRKRQKRYTYILSIPLTAGLKKAFDRAAREERLPTAVWARRILFKEVGQIQIFQRSSEKSE